jgi:hypothetical protein
MESPAVANALFRELINSVHTLYRAAPAGAFKNGDEFYAALRAADKGKALLEGDVERLVLMEREDAAYWRRRFFQVQEPDASAVAIDVAPPVPYDGLDSPLSVPASSATAPHLPVLNPEEEDGADDDVSSIGIQSDNGFLVEPPLRPHINLFGITATPNLGPLLPSPMMTHAMYEEI